MDGPRDCHTERRESHISYDTTYMWKKKFFNGTNVLVCRTEIRVTDVGNKLVVAKKELGGYKLEDWDWDIQTTIYKIDN